MYKLNRKLMSIFLIFVMLSPTFSSTTDYYIVNGKDVVGQTDKNGNTIKEKYQYSSYGEERDLKNGSPFNLHNSSFTVSANPFRYSSYYRDSESSMDYLQARYYSPKLMRFISRDSYDLENRYAYGDADPVNMIDPEGHSAWDWIGLGAALLATVASIIPSAGSSASVAAFFVGNSISASVSMTQAIKNNDTKMIIASGIQLAACLSGVYSAQPTLFSIGAEARDGAARLDLNETNANVFLNRGLFSTKEVEKETSTPLKLMLLDPAAKENRGKIYQNISSLLSQGLGGLSSGIVASDGTNKEMVIYGDLGLTMGIFGGLFYAGISNVLKGANALSGLAKYGDSIWKGALRTGLTGVLQQSANIFGNIINGHKMDGSYWQSQGINTVSNIALGAYSGFSQQAVTFNKGSKLALGGRTGYLFLNAPIVQKILSNRLNDYVDFSLK